MCFVVVGTTVAASGVSRSTFRATTQALAPICGAEPSVLDVVAVLLLDDVLRAA